MHATAHRYAVRMKLPYLCVPALFLFSALPAQACVNTSSLDLLIAGAAATIVALLLTLIGQSSLLFLVRNRRFTRLGWLTMGSLSVLHLLVGLGCLLIGLSAGPGGVLTGLLIALPFLLLSGSGFRSL